VPKALPDQLYQHARIPRHYWDARLDRSNAPLMGFIHNLEGNLKLGVGLLLLGPNGVGKTFQACAILKAALQHTARVMYITAPNLVQAYIDTPMFDDDIDMIEALTNRRLLVVDDLGQEYRGSGSGHSEQRILNLIRDRIQGDRSTVITTNFSTKQLQETYGEGFASLLQEGLVTIPLKGGDRRRENRPRLLEQSGVKG
jgi:DNA replication protein DnaC